MAGETNKAMSNVEKDPAPLADGVGARENRNVGPVPEAGPDHRANPKPLIEATASGRIRASDRLCHDLSTRHHREGGLDRREGADRFRLSDSATTC